jgi:hypothetical protein
VVGTEAKYRTRSGVQLKTNNMGVARMMNLFSDYVTMNCCRNIRADMRVSVSRHEVGPVPVNTYKHRILHKHLRKLG